MHVAQAFGAMLPNPARHAGIVIQHADVTFAIARGREHTLEVRSIQALLRLPEPVHEEGLSARMLGRPSIHRAIWPQAGTPRASSFMVTAVLYLSDHPDREMVAQVLAYSWKSHEPAEH